MLNAGGTPSNGGKRACIPYDRWNKIMPIHWSRDLASIWKDRVTSRGVTSTRELLLSMVVVNEQSCITSKRCTIYCILALRILIERLRDFRCALFAAFVLVWICLEGQWPFCWKIQPPFSKIRINMSGFHKEIIMARLLNWDPAFLPQHSSTLAWTKYWEGCRRSRCGLFAAFVDLCKAFDAVNRYILWEILNLRGILSNAHVLDIWLEYRNADLCKFW